MFSLQALLGQQQDSEAVDKISPGDVIKRAYIRSN